MELTQDLVHIQGVLTGASTKVGDLTKILYKGGNEHKIQEVIVSIDNFLRSRNYIKDDEFNDCFKEQLERICLYLILNSDFNKEINAEEYAHLIPMKPVLSLCLLTNIFTALRLGKYYCPCLGKIPYSCCKDILDELIPIIKKADLDQQLEDIYLIIHTIICKVSEQGNITEKDGETITDILRAIEQLLLNFTGVDPDKLKNLKRNRVNRHMGYVLLKIFDLLLHVDHKNEYLEKLVEDLLRAACSIAQCITINIYCYWAELEEDDGQSLQSKISGKAYEIIEKYQKVSSAATLISMMSTFAVKPKTTTQQIQEADVATTIKMINKADSNQRQWFKALFLTDILVNEEARKCVLRWSHLCSEEEVSRLLNLCDKNLSAECKQLIIQCAYSLDVSKLILVTIRHFYKNGFIILNEDVKHQLLLIFNKLAEKATLPDDLLKEILLLLLQNPQEVLCYIYSESLKNVFYTTTLKDLFSAMKDIVKVNNIGLKCFHLSSDVSKPNEQNLLCYTALLNFLLSINYFVPEQLIAEFFEPKIQEFYTKGNLRDTKMYLELFKEINVTINLCQKTEPILNLLLIIINECRGTFLNCDLLKQEILRNAVCIINKKVLRSSQPCPGIEVAPEDSCFIKYYKCRILGLQDCSLFNQICGNNSTDKSIAICKLLQLLPSCVVEEWISVSSEINDYKNLINILKDVIVLLCQITRKEENNSNFETLLRSLQYNLQNYRISLKEISKETSLEDETVLTNSIIEVLCELPDVIKEEEGIILLELITQRSLKELGKEKEFVCKICLIKNNNICKVIAQKILN